MDHVGDAGESSARRNLGDDETRRADERAYYRYQLSQRFDKHAEWESANPLFA
jgi:hypothetical protein